jgi:hypothetical protein
MAAVPGSFALLVAIAASTATSAAAPAYEIDVADVPAGVDACPSREQVAESLEAHMPGVVARSGRATGPGLLHLALAISPEGVARVTMTDATGAVRLERELDIAASGGGQGRGAVPRDRSSCVAVAETVTLIIERYMRHLGYHEPPPPALVPPPEPPAPQPAAPPPEGPERGRLGLGVFVRPPYDGPTRVEPTLSGALRLGALELGASIGATWPVHRAIPMSDGAGSFTLLAFPLRVSLGVPLALGDHLTVVPAVAAGIDLVLAETKGIGATRRSSAAEPVVEAGLAFRVALTRRIWIDLQAFQGLDLRPEEFFVTDLTTSRPVTIMMTPRTYTRVGANFGFCFGNLAGAGKN